MKYEILNMKSWLKMKKVGNSKRKTMKNMTIFMQNKPNSPNVQTDLSLFIAMFYTIFTSLTKVKNKPNSNPIKANYSRNKPNSSLSSNVVVGGPISKAEKRTKEAKKKKRVSGTFLHLWIDGKIDFLDGCDIILGKIYGKFQFNLFGRLIL